MGPPILSFLLFLLLGADAQPLPESVKVPFGDPLVLQQIAERPSKCGQKCREFGTCNEELGRCDCPRDREGPNCEVQLDEVKLKWRCLRLGFLDVPQCLKGFTHCLNGCNNRGMCLRGYCHCQPGHYGMDCSLSLDSAGQPQLLQGTGYTTRAKRPWVYVYELPPELTTWRQMNHVDRPTFFYFLQRLLGSGARIADPAKADYFLIPIYMRHSAEGGSSGLRTVLRHIKTTWPYYNNSRPGSHFVFHIGDWGKAEAINFRYNVRTSQLARASDEVRSNLKWLTHWGIYNNSKKPFWNLAHTPGMDVVIPVITPATRLPVFGHDKSPLHPSYVNPPPRDKTLFFAGRICGEPRPPDTTKPWPHNCQNQRYSGGVRQRVHSFHHNRTGFMVSPHIPSYGLQLRTSKYCLATQGGGHGNRQVIAALAGCLPVSIGDGIYEPFEPEMDYSAFGLRVPEEQIPFLHEIIDSVGEEGYARKQNALRCGAQHLHWASMVGGMMHESGRYDAFETTLEVMRAQADNPNTAPQDFAKVDKDFKRFMACGAEEFGDVPPPEPKDIKLCSNSALDSEPMRCKSCLVGRSGTLGPPGGAACCGYKDLSKCPRTWD